MKSLKFWRISLILAALAGVAYLAPARGPLTAMPPEAKAQSYNAYFTGYAWSDTVGWISFNGSGYGVTVNTDNTTLAGYAWSDNAGWISFNQADLGGCPSGTCSARIVNGALGGWTRARAGVGRTDGWDGWISLSGASPSYGPALPGGQTSGLLSGYAWGSDVVGWIDFSVTAFNPGGVTVVSTAPPPPPALPTINSFNATRVQRGERSTLSWMISNMVSGISCSLAPAASGGSALAWNGSALWTSSTTTQPLSTAMTFTLSCGNGSATTTKQTSATLVPTFEEI